MSLLVLAYPNLAQSDFDRIQKVRAEYDRQYFAIVEPHFTLVFPVAKVSESDFLLHVEKQIKGFRPFLFVLRSAVVVRNTATESSHVFLSPGEGSTEFTALHDRLYAGILAGEPRFNLPYMPHITIAVSNDPAVCKSVADSWNAAGITIAGSIECLDVVRYDENGITTIRRIPLD